MPDILSELQAIEQQPKGKDVQFGIVNSLKKLATVQENVNINAITSGEVYELLHSLRDAGEVRY